MMSCEIFRRHVDVVVDGEVDPSVQIEFEQHLESCGPCRVHLSFSRTFKAHVREALTENEPAVPTDLAARIRASMDDIDAQRAGQLPRYAPRTPLGLRGIRILPVRARYAVPAAAAAFALAVIAAREGGNPVAPGDLKVEAWDTGCAALPGSAYLEDVVERHWREHPAEVSGPPTRVASWFRGKLEFPVRPMEFATPDAELVGARISNVRDRDAAAFYYNVRGQRVTVMVFEPDAALRSTVRETHVSGRGIFYGNARGYTVPVVEHGGVTYAIAGDMTASDLLRLAATARVQGR